MIEIKDVNKLSNKFSLLLSKAYHEANISIDVINEKITFGDYFDFLEKDELNSFLDKDLDAIIRELFGPTIFHERVNDIGELYWAGQQYISIFLNCFIPLRTIFLLFPLDEMVSCFDAYHDKSKFQLIKDFKNNKYLNRSILRSLRKQKGLSVKQLSSLTKIPEQTLKYYESNNRFLYNAPFNSILKIYSVLSCSLYFFKKESDFVPFSNNIMKSDVFLDYLSTEIKSNLKIDSLYLDKITYNINEVEQPCLYIGDPSFVMYIKESKDERKLIFDYILKPLLKSAIHRASNDCLSESCTLF